MRRFELSEGTSNKFWQIEREGTDIRVQFGRIGSQGQEQRKPFASSAAAQAELDRLIREKTKKGYREVSAPGDDAQGAGSRVAPAPAASAPTPAPAPAPVSAPTPASPSEAIVAPRPAKAAPGLFLSEAALREAAPIRGSQVVPVRRPDGKALYLRLSKAMRDAATLLDNGAEKSNANRPLMAAARSAFASVTPPETLDLEAQAAAFALIGPKAGYAVDPHADDFVRYWLALAGGSFALAAFARADQLQVEATDKELAVVEGKAVLVHWWRTRHCSGWRGLRSLAVLAQGDEYENVRAQAESVARDVQPTARAMLAAAFECLAWAKQDLESMSGGSNTPAWFWPLFVSADSLEEAKQMLKRANVNSVWELASAIDEVRFDVVARYEAAAGPFLRDIIAQAGSTGVDRMRSLAEALACVVMPEVAEFFVQQLAAKELRSVASTYLQTHVEVSLLPLAMAAAAGKGALADAARATLRPMVVSAPPEALAAAKTSLPASAQQLVSQLEEQTRAREDARVEDLPRVLAAPPWATKAMPTAPVVLDLAPLPYPESMAWRPGEPQSWLLDSALPKEAPEEAPDTLALLSKASSSKPEPNEHSWRRTSASTLARLPKEALIEILPTLDLGRFHWSYHNVAKELVARHGVDMVEFALRSAQQDAVSAVAALVRANSARVAPLMADAFVRLKKARDDASAWLSAFPEAATIGLLPTALGKPGKGRETAELALRYSARGQREAVEMTAKRYGAAAEAGVRVVLDFDPLLAYPAKLPKLPPFWSAGAFARPMLRGDQGALPLAAVDAIGTMLAFTSFDDPYQGLLDVRDACDRRSLADFGWDLFQAWLVAGAASKESWAFLALSLFGDDETARKLTPLIRAWPGEAAHARAVMGLDVLARLGSDVALMHLHGIAQKVKFKGLQERAREKIDQIAEARGLTAEELADRLVPDLGLDESGSLQLDFGPRHFRVVFDETLKPAVLDDADKRLPDLPKPRQSDEEEKAKVATEIWKALKKDARTIASGQILRLEIAMCAERRWTTGVFRQFLVEHPLLVHVARRLLWGTYGSDGRLVSTFRVAEDRTLADVQDEAVEIAPDATVGIVHRLDLEDSTAAAWGQIFADYEVLQPFHQLSREINVPSAAERDGKELTRVEGWKVPTGKVLGLDHRGWRRGPPQDAGVVNWYEKPTVGGLVVCLSLDPGIYTGTISESPEQTLGKVTLSRGEYSWRAEEHVAFGALSRIAFSELVRDLESLRL